MKSFFKSNIYTEAMVIDTDDIWVYGDTAANITENTPRAWVGTRSYDGSSGMNVPPAGLAHSTLHGRNLTVHVLV